MYKKSVLAGILIAFFVLTNAHSQSNQINKKGFFAGPSFGFQLGTIGRFEAGPIAGYQFNEWFLAGVSGRYLYYRDKRLNFNFTSHIYGGSAFAEFTVIQDLARTLPLKIPGSIYLHGEAQLLSVPSREFSVPYTAQNERFLLPGYLVGGGWRQSAGKKSWIYVLALYDLNNSFRFPYENPFVRFGLVF